MRTCKHMLLCKQIGLSALLALPHSLQIALQISEKQLYQMEKELKTYESMINVMQDEVRIRPCDE